MPRAKQGGARQGTPGKGYSNRTDLMNKYDNAGSSAAAGGMEAPPAAPMPQGPTPEDSPNLTAPTERPDEPITTGLNTGPGNGPQRVDLGAETRDLQRFLPLIGAYLDQPDTPDSVRQLFRYIKGA